MKQVGTIRRISGIVSTDDIIPARYKHMYTAPEDLAPHMFEAYAPELVRRLQAGDVLVSDSLFGIGSSREQAVTTMLASGIAAVLAPSFGRILFRNSWNLALPAIDIDTRDLADGMPIEIDLESGEVLRYFPAPSAFLLEMVAAGGLLQKVRASLGAAA